MSEEEQFNSLEAFSKRLGENTTAPPIHLWHPEKEGVIDIRIAKDGSWYHEGGIINRQSMVRLFASILRLEEGGYYLINPEYKLRIKVDDAPFIAISVHVQGEAQARLLTFTTNLGDVVAADVSHPIEIKLDENSGELKPYIHVRGGLTALISRNTFYAMAEMVEEQSIKGQITHGVWSGGEFFPLE